MISSTDRMIFAAPQLFAPKAKTLEFMDGTITARIEQNHSFDPSPIDMDVHSHKNIIYAIYKWLNFPLFDGS